ncbi:hypothetical protein Aph02nite_01070 [Actinoplanes philippinensis]|uniref:Uncharacterized protein n=1 Tax=Actinoplanes philippinensis TaxID=35752 RepID=A0A1I2HNN8_9ACTN|nr:hypothetical protein [Actinoplanes philippinensis]GIE74157.1 hypothetical protein Aph02nite_01070 [Actinoplanes philippinensis]SFF31128.1 hypothetical protein SAMN05421541_108368 [Actinoplanes philippinensis]
MSSSSHRENARRRLRHAGDRLLTVVGDWTAPGERPAFSDNSLSTLVRTVTLAAGGVFLIAMLIIWLVR